MTFDDLAAHAEGLLAGVLPSVVPETSVQDDDVLLSQALQRYRELFGDRCYLLAELHLGPDDERPSPQTSYRVKAKTANIRKGPDVSEEVLAEVPEGTVLEASAVKGDWVKVTYNGTAGWVSRSVVE